MEAALFFGMLVLGGLVLLPIIALVSSSKLSRRVTQAEEDARLARKELDELRRRLHAATERADGVDQRLTAWVSFFQHEPGAAPKASAAPDAVAAAPPSAEIGTPVEAPSVAEPPPAEPVAPASEASPASVATSEEPAGDAPSAPTFDPPTPFDWERLVGVRLFAWLGGGALFLAAALFLHYSIQQNLIAPPIRVATGLAVGAVALLGGDRVRHKARYAGDAVSGAGVAILFAALFAARVLYQLIPLSAAFAGMTLVTVTAGLFAVRRDAYFVALLGLLGGMATPYLLSSGEDRPLALFAYVALLSCGTVAVARQRGWSSLAMLGLLGAMLVFIGWATKFLVAARAPYALGAVALVAAPFAFVRVAKPPGELNAARTPAQRMLSGIAALLPLATGVALAGLPTIDVDPTVLALYVLVLSVGVFIADRRHCQANLPVVAAALASLALLCRVGPDLFPVHEAQALGSFSLVPLAYFAAALALRRGPFASAARHAAVITLLSTLPVVIAAATHESAQPIRLCLAYAWLGAGGLVAFAVIYGESWYFAAAELVAFGALAALVRSDASRLGEFALPLAVSAVFFWGLPFTHVRCRKERVAWWSSAAALPVHFLLLYTIAQETWGRSPLGAVAVLGAVLTAVSLRGVTSLTSEPEARLELLALFGGLTLAFATASVPLLLENEWLTISWAAEVAALAWLRRRVPHGGLILAAALLAAGVSVRLVANEALWTYHARSATPILNYYLYTFGVPALAFLAAQRWLAADDLANRFRLPAALGFAGALLLFVLMNVEIADYYSSGVSLTFRLSGGSLAEDMTYSLAWGAFAIVLMLVGMATKRRSTRIGALTVLVLTVGKVFLHDLWKLGSLYRVGSIVGLAIALLGVSFLTQRFILPKEQP